MAVGLVMSCPSTQQVTQDADATLNALNLGTDPAILSDDVWDIRYEQHGTTIDYRNGSYTYSTSVGEQNVWNGTHWMRYIYDPELKRVQIGGLTFTHGPNGVIAVNHTGSGFAIERLKWYAQYYYNDAWQNFTFDNYQFVGVIETDDNVTATQRWWSANGELNVSYTYTYWGDMKMRAWATNWNTLPVPVRIIWAALDIQATGLDYSLIYDNGTAVGVDIGNDQKLSWHDVVESAPQYAINPVVDRANHRAAVVFGNQSSVLAQYETMDIDPTYTISADIDDDEWDTGFHYTGNDVINVHDYFGEDHRGQFRVALAIPKDSTINTATLSVYVLQATSASITIARIDETNVGSLEGDSSMPDYTATEEISQTLLAATGWRESNSIVGMVQDQVELAGWVSGYYMGVQMRSSGTDYTSNFEAHDDSNSNHAKMDITYTEPNEAPTLGPTVARLTAPDDTDNLYSRYKEYELTLYAVDLDGYADIDFIDFQIWSDDRGTKYFHGRFVQTTHVFSEQGAPVEKTYWELDAGGSSYSEHDTTKLDVTWMFYVEWACPDVTDMDVYAYVVDEQAAYDDHYYEDTWDGSNLRECDIETDLTYDTSPTVTSDDAGTIDRGDLDEAFHITGNVGYEGSTLTPPSAAVDVMVAVTSGGYGTTTGPFEDDTIDAGGDFDVTCYADDAVGIETYTIKVVNEGDGYGGTDLIAGADPTDTYIADRVEISWIVLPDDHVGAGLDATVYYYIRFEYLTQSGVTGTFTTDATEDDLNYMSGIQWSATVNEPVGSYVFDGFTTCVETLHGLTGWTNSWSSETLVFDTVRALAIEVSDDRCDYGTAQTVRVQFDYESSAYGYVTSWSTYPTITGPNGAITLNSYDGSGWWNGTTGTYSTVGIHNYNTNTLNDFIDGDSILSRTKASYAEYTIWDRVEIYLLTSEDSHLGVGYGTNLNYYLRYDYNNIQVDFGGTYSTDETADSINHQSSNWWIATPNEAGVGAITFNGFTACSDTGYGLTVWIFTGIQATVTWDRVRALAIQRSDDRCNYGSNQWVQVQFDYESAGYGYVTSWSTTPTITGPNGVIQLTQDIGSGWWRGETGTYSSISRFDYNTNTLNDFIDADNVLSRTKGSFTDYTIWDRVNLTLITNLGWTIIIYNTTLTATGEFEYDSSSWSGAVTWANEFPSESTVGTYDYGASAVTSITDPSYDVTIFAIGEEATVIFDNVVPSGAIAKSWMQFSFEQVYLIWGIGSNWKWDYNDTLLEINVVLHAYSNSSDPQASGGTYGSGAFGGLTIGPYNPDWHYVDLDVNCEFSHNGIDYDWEIWSQVLEVEILHTIYIENFNIEPTDYYFWITYQSNWNNASITIWDDAINSGTAYSDAIYWSTSEGMHQFSRSTIIASHNITILLNGSATAQNQQVKDFSVDDAWWWYNFTYVIVEPPSYDCHIVILNNLYEVIPFDTFEVYKNDTRIYHDIIQVVNDNAYNITIKNRFGDTVNETIFSADFEMVVFVNTYSFKFMNWYNGFLRVNVTRAGVTYSEIIMPMEIIEFNLFEETYVFSVDFLNGTTKFEQEITVTNSTGYVITGDSLTDVFDLVNSVWAMTTAINITVTSTNNYALTISVDLININTTIGYQLVQVLLNITNTNSTIYDQTVDLLAYMQNVNSTLYDQTATFIVNVYNNQTAIYSQTVTLLSNLENVNSTIYSQTVWMLSNLTNVNSTIYSQTVSILASISNTNATLYAQTLSILTNITNVNSTIYSQTISILNYVWNSANSIYNQTLSILSDIQNTNATIYAQTLSLLSNITNVNSTIYAQTLTILTNIENVNSTIYAQTLSILSNITNVNATIYAQTVSILSDISNVNITLYTQTLSILSNITNVNSTIFSQTVDIISYVWNSANSIYNQTINILSDIQNTNSTIYSQTVSILSSITNINSTIYSQTVDILNYVWNNATSIYNQTITLLSDISNVNTTLYTQTVTLLSNLENVNSTLYTQTITLISDISNVNTTLYTQTVTLLSDISNVNTTLYAQTVTLLSDIENVNSTIYSQTVDIISYVWNSATSIYNQTVSILSDIQNTNTTIYSQTVSILSSITNVNSTIYSQTIDILNYVWNNATSIYNQTITILADISNVNTTLYSQTVSILADVSNVNSTLYAQTLTILTNIENVNSTLYTQTLSILTDIQNTNSTLYAQTIQVLANISNTNSTLYSQAITILSDISNVNSTIYSQTLTILSNLSELNATVFLVDDPTNLNPLVLGSKLSDDYCDFTIVTNWHNASATIYDDDALRIGPVSELTSPIRCPLRDTVGTHNLSMYIDAGADSFWYNISYTISAAAGTPALAIEVFDFDATGYYITITCITNWANTTIYMYDNTTLKAWASEGSDIQFPMPTAVGFHNLTFFIDGGAQTLTRQRNYTIAVITTGTAEIRFAFFDSADNWVPFETIYCNLTQSGITYILTSATATVSTTASMTLEVYNKWGVLISNTTFSYTQFKSITLGLYELIIDNEADHLVRLDISYNGTYPNITIMLPRNFPRFLYLASANYTMIFTYYAPATEGVIVNYEELTGYYVTYEYELTTIGYLKYTGISLADIQYNIDYTRTITNENIDVVDLNVLAIPFPPPVPQNVVSPEDFWILVLGFAAVAALFAIFGHGIKGWQIAKKTRITFYGDRNRSNEESYRSEGMPR